MRAVELLWVPCDSLNWKLTSLRTFTVAYMGYIGASNEKILSKPEVFSHDFMKEELFRSIMDCSPMLWSLGCKEQASPPLAVKHITMNKKGKPLRILKRLYNFFITFPQCSERVRLKYASSIRMNKPLQTESKYSQTRHHVSNCGTSSSSISWLPASLTLNVRTIFYGILDFSCTAFLRYVHINNAERTSSHTGTLQYTSTLTWVSSIPSFCSCSLMHHMSLELLADRSWQRSFHCQLTQSSNP